MSKVHKPRTKGSDKITRARAEKLLANGADPSEDRFVKHGNYHVRARSFKLLGSPFPSDEQERAKLCKDLHVKDPVLVEAARLKAEADRLQAEADAAELAQLELTEQAQAAEPVVVAVETSTTEVVQEGSTV